jgi:hypothetical protein
MKQANTQQLHMLQVMSANSAPAFLAVRALLNLVVQTSTAGPLSHPLLP